MNKDILRDFAYSNDELPIFFHDLVPEAQERLLDYMHVESPKDLNWDIFPFTTFEVNIDGCT